MDDLSPKDKLKLALAWLREMKAIPDASLISAARIYHINEETVKSVWFREKNRGTPRPRGGHNRILSEAQYDALI